MSRKTSELLAEEEEEDYFEEEGELPQQTEAASRIRSLSAWRNNEPEIEAAEEGGGSRRHSAAQLRRLTREILVGDSGPRFRQMKCEYLHVSRHILKRSIVPSTWKECTLNLTATQIEFVKMDVKRGKRNSTEGEEIKTAYGKGVGYKKQVARIYATIELQTVDKVELETPQTPRGVEAEEGTQFRLGMLRGSDWPHVSIRMESAESVEEMMADIEYNLSNRTWQGRRARATTSTNTRNRSASGYRGVSHSVSTGSRRMTAGGINGSSLLSFSQTEATPLVGTTSGRALQNRLEKGLEMGATGFERSVEDQETDDVAAANPMRAAATSGATAGTNSAVRTATRRFSLDGDEPVSAWDPTDPTYLTDTSPADDLMDDLTDSLPASARSRAVSTSLEFASKRPPGMSAKGLKRGQKGRRSTRARGKSVSKNNATSTGATRLAKTDSLVSVEETGDEEAGGGGVSGMVQEAVQGVQGVQGVQAKFVSLEALQELHEDRRRQCGNEAVDRFVNSNHIVGLGGSGPIASYVCERLGENVASGVLTGVTVVPMSAAAAEHARRLGLPIGDLDSHPDIDVAIDGADEVDDALDFITRMDGSLLRTRMVMAMAKTLVVVADENGYSPHLTARRQIPVEVAPHCAEHSRRRLLAIRSLQGCGCTASLRKVADGSSELYKAESGNNVVDIRVLYGEIDKEGVGGQINSLFGVVAHGLVVGRASAVVMAGEVVGGVQVKEMVPANGSPDMYRYT
jgi:ribose 5-phosphate isomerase A